MKHPCVLVLALLALLFTACSPAADKITKRQRTEAANFVSEADFAMQIRDYPRAESLYLKATGLCPDTGDYWVALGASRRRLEQRDGARKAYEKALGAFKDAYQRQPGDTRSLLEQVHVFALLGRMDEAKKLLQQAVKKHGKDPLVRNFAAEGGLERLMQDDRFRTMAL